RAVELGFTGLGLTDTADLGGAVRFALEARRLGIRPIIGAELEVDGRPIGLLARDAEGYRNLAALVTRARSGALERWQPGQPEVPRGHPGIRWTDLAARSAGLHLLTGPAAGPVAALVRAERAPEAARLVAEWREVFGHRLAIEVQRHHAGSREAALADALIELAGREGVPWVAAQDPRYLGNRSRLVHDMLTALRAGLTLEAAAHAGVLLPSGRWRLQSPEEMRTLWQREPEGLETGERIALECGFALAWMRPPLPRFPVPEGQTDASFLRQQVEA